MNDDAQLLRRYGEDHSESAFAELVARHIDPVYSAALRQLNGDTHLAQDVAQTVFADLARKARALSRHEVLTGWLYQATRFAAAKAVRTERRRSSHERRGRAQASRPRFGKAAALPHRSRRDVVGGYASHRPGR